MIKKCIGANSIRTIILLTLIMGFFAVDALKASASDNVLQAIQVEGVKDSYKIILRSDDSAELQKTIQAPNKMILHLKGIRASKSINTIYNNTASVDSVVVEPTSADSVKISIQADNVDKADVQFDTLKTPLGILEKTEAQKSADQLILNKPMQSYTPVYNENEEEADNSGFSLSGIMAGSTGNTIKNVLKDRKISWLVAFGMFTIMVLSGIKAVKGKDGEIKIGLTQSLKEKELDLYREMGMNNPLAGATLGSRPGFHTQAQAPSANLTGANYGLKAYQNGTRNPYVSSEIQRPRPTAAPKQTFTAPAAPSRISNVTSGVQNTIQNTATRAANPALKQPGTNTANRTTNIDSMKFLESMTKIYEKNGRTDLAQGLKTNMKKAQTNMSIR